MSVQAQAATLPADTAASPRIWHGEAPHSPALPASLQVPCGWRSAVLDRILRHLARRIVQGVPDRSLIDVRMVQTSEDWAEIRRLRLEGYAATIPYMLSVLDESGADEFDQRSLVFGVWLGGRPVATVRYTRWPFEVAQYLSGDAQEAVPFLSDRDRTLELSRLLVSPTAGVNRLMPALLTYSGLFILFNTAFRQYVGYAKTEVVRKLNAFRCETGPITVSIPDRGDHRYELLLGEFLTDAEHFLRRKCRVPLIARAIRRLLPKA